MRFVLITILLLNSALSIAQQAEFKFKDKVIRIGKVKEGSIEEFKYTFTNVGDLPLTISHFEVACTCTEVTYSKEPILPGQDSEIIVRFDSKGKMGYQDRTILLFSNAENSPFKIRFTLSVKNY